MSELPMKVPDPGDEEIQFDLEPSSKAISLPDIKPNGKTRRFVIGDDELSEPPDFAIISYRCVRTLFSKPYSEMGADERPVVVCGSVDGDAGYGYGGRDTKARVCERKCRACPMSWFGDKYAPPVCPERFEALVVLNGDDGAFPAWLHIAGVAVAPFTDMLKKLAGRVRRGAKQPLVGVAVSGWLKRGNNTYAPEWGLSTEVAGDWKRAVVEFAASEPGGPPSLAFQVWRQRIADHEASLATIGQDGPESHGPQGAIKVESAPSTGETKADRGDSYFDEMPF